MTPNSNHPASAAFVPSPALQFVEAEAAYKAARTTEKALREQMLDALKLLPEDAQRVLDGENYGLTFADCFAVAYNLGVSDTMPAPVAAVSDAALDTIDNLHETLRSIAGMNPATEGERMRQWARDGLRGFTETNETTMARLVDEIAELKKQPVAAVRAEAKADSGFYIVGTVDGSRYYHDNRYQSHTLPDDARRFGSSSEPMHATKFSHAEEAEGFRVHSLGGEEQYQIYLCRFSLIDMKPLAYKPFCAANIKSSAEIGADELRGVRAGAEMPVVGYMVQWANGAVQRMYVGSDLQRDLARAKSDIAEPCCNAPVTMFRELHTGKSLVDGEPTAPVPDEARA